MFSDQGSQESNAPVSLYTQGGQRKYLTEHERQRFIDSAQSCERSIRLLCLVLLFSGCRISEALNLSAEHILKEDNGILIRSLKKRAIVSYRQIPLPPAIIDDLCSLSVRQPKRLFAWQRTQALYHIKSVMKQAGIDGIRGTARGLRHTFGTHGIRSGVPVTMLQRWLGHSKITTTVIYTQILGPEEYEIAKRMW